MEFTLAAAENTRTLIIYKHKQWVTSIHKASNTKKRKVGGSFVYSFNFLPSYKVHNWMWQDSSSEIKILLNNFKVLGTNHIPSCLRYSIWTTFLPGALASLITGLDLFWRGKKEEEINSTFWFGFGYGIPMRRRPRSVTLAQEIACKWGFLECFFWIPHGKILKGEVCWS